MKNKLWVIAILTAFTLSTTPCFAQGGGDKTTTSPAGDKTTTSPAEAETTSPAGTETTSPTGIVMVSIPAGTFIMGSPASEPDRESGGADETQHSVTLSGFKMSKYEVTQEQYQAVMGSNPSYNVDVRNDGENPGKRPVESVSWYDAIVFCNRLSIKEGLRPAYSLGGNTDPAAWGNVPTLTFQNATWNAMQIVEGSNGYRLPTEAQWEYACRAGTTTAYNTGNTISDDTGWYAGNRVVLTATYEVGLKPANAWGLHDMHGNVSEWCWDWYGRYPSEAQTNPMGPSSGDERVERGGFYMMLARGLRSALRIPSGPYSRTVGTGIRLVRP